MLLHLCPDDAAQLVQVLGAPALREGVVDVRGQPFPHLLDRDLEEGGDRCRSLVRRPGIRIGLGRRHVDRHLALVVRLGADQWPSQLGHDRVLAELERHVGAAPLFVRLAVDLDGDVDQDLVAFLRRARLRHRLEALLRLGEPGERVLDRILAHLRLEPGDGEVGELAELDLRQDLHSHREFEVGALVERGDLDLGLHGGAKRALFQDLARAGLDRLLQHLAQHARLVVAAHDRERHLAGAKALHGHGLAQLVEPPLDVGLKVGRRNRHLELASQPFREGLRHLHRLSLMSRSAGSAGVRQGNGRGLLVRWCGRRDSNPHGLSHVVLNHARLPIPPRPRVSGAPVRLRAAPAFGAASGAL